MQVSHLVKDISAISMRILIADDNERIRRALKEIISSETHSEVCGEAADGEMALRLARELRPDLVLLDVSMPGLGGLEVARMLRHESPEIKIIIMSQHDPRQLLPRAIEAGAHACVDKGRLNPDLFTTMKGIDATPLAPGGPMPD